MNIQNLARTIKNPKFYLGKKKKFINLIYLLFGSNVFGGGSAIATKKQLF